MSTPNTNSRHYLNYLNDVGTSSSSSSSSSSSIVDEQDSGIEDMSRYLGNTASNGYKENIEAELMGSNKIRKRSNNSNSNSNNVRVSSSPLQPLESIVAEAPTPEHSLYLDMSRMSNTSDDILPPPSPYPLTPAQNGSEGESVVDLDSIDGTDGDSSGDENETETETENQDGSDDERQTTRTYLSVSPDGRIVPAIVSDTADDRSVSSIPRSALGAAAAPTRSVLSLSQEEEDGAEEDNDDYDDVEDYHNSTLHTSGAVVIDPPNAMDYAPAECFTPRTNSVPLPLSNISNRHSRVAAIAQAAVAESEFSGIKSKKKDKSKKKKKDNKKTKKNEASEPSSTPTNRFAKEPKKLSVEQAAAAHILATQELPPPARYEAQASEAGHDAEATGAATNLAGSAEYNNNYSHLLAAYEFEHDPSIPPLPPPEFALVQSPTDEQGCRSTSGHRRGSGNGRNGNGNGSPNTSYESDIEIGQVAERDARKAPTSAAKRLMAIFSPTYFRTASDTVDQKDRDTPETDAMSPTSGARGRLATRGRKLFYAEHKNNSGHEDSVYDEYCAESDYSDPTLGSSKTRGGRNDRKQVRCMWIWVIALLVLVLVAATSIIAHYMITQAKAVSASTDTFGDAASAVVDLDPSLAEKETPKDSQSDQIFVDSQTNKDPSPPVADIVADPTTAPTLGPTLEPTLAVPSPSPTMVPITDSPTRSKSAGDQIAERLEALLQEQNYANDEGSAAEPFSFDFSDQNIASGGMDDPAHQALIYLAREAETLQRYNEELALFIASSAETTSPAKELGNVVVVSGGAPIPGDPKNFVPIDILNQYDDEQLVQRFALLALRFAAQSGDTGAMDDDEAVGTLVPTSPGTNGPIFIANTPVLPAKRIVLPGGVVETGSANIDAISEQSATVDSAAASGNDSADQETIASAAATAVATASPTISAPASPADPIDPWFLVDECDWDGVECSSDNTTSSLVVSALRWDYSDLSGTISPSIGLLSKGLTRLDLSNNQLTGSLPESLYDLTNLRDLYLFHNDLTGTLSTNIGRFDQLERLHLSHNALTGTLPKELKSDGGSVNGIRPLKYFNVYSNRLTGTIPLDLRWRQCTYFDVGRNELTGTLPEDLGEKFVELRHLFLDHNALSGTFPSSYNSVGNGRLVALAIDHNRLTGEVPGAREHYDNLVQYTLHENRFTSLDQSNCQNHYLVEFKADCPDVCTCFGRFFDFCDRWCGYSGSGNTKPSQNPNLNWQQQQQQQQQQQPQRPQWQRQPQNDWSF